MKQKLGPLQLWQWAAIGVAAGLGYYLYLRGKSSGQPPQPTPTVAQTDNTAQPYGPIDPTTGLPFAFSLLGPPPTPAPPPPAQVVIRPPVIRVTIEGGHRLIGPPVRRYPPGPVPIGGRTRR